MHTVSACAWFPLDLPIDALQEYYAGLQAALRNAGVSNEELLASPGHASARTGPDLADSLDSDADSLEGAADNLPGLPLPLNCIDNMIHAMSLYADMPVEELTKYLIDLKRLVEPVVLPGLSPKPKEATAQPQPRAASRSGAAPGIDLFKTRTGRDAASGVAPAPGELDEALSDSSTFDFSREWGYCSTVIRVCSGWYGMQFLVLGNVVYIFSCERCL